MSCSVSSVMPLLPPQCCCRTSFCIHTVVEGCYQCSWIEFLLVWPGGGLLCCRCSDVGRCLGQGRSGFWTELRPLVGRLSVGAGAARPQTSPLFLVDLLHVLLESLGVAFCSILLGHMRGLVVAVGETILFHKPVSTYPASILLGPPRPVLHTFSCKILASDLLWE